MLSFTSSLSPNSEAFAIFVTEKYDYNNKRDILPKNTVQKINCEKKFTSSSVPKTKLSGQKAILLIFLFFFIYEKKLPPLSWGE